MIHFNYSTCIISDQHIGCCLWDNFAENMIAACKDGEENNTLCLLRFAKISVFQGKFLTNYLF